MDPPITTLTVDRGKLTRAIRRNHGAGNRPDRTGRVFHKRGDASGGGGKQAMWWVKSTTTAKPQRGSPFPPDRHRHRAARGTAPPGYQAGHRGRRDWPEVRALERESLRLCFIKINYAAQSRMEDAVREVIGCFYVLVGSGRMGRWPGLFSCGPIGSNPLRQPSFRKHLTQGVITKI